MNFTRCDRCGKEDAEHWVIHDPKFEEIFNHLNRKSWTPNQIPKTEMDICDDCRIPLMRMCLAWAEAIRKYLSVENVLAQHEFAARWARLTVPVLVPKNGADTPTSCDACPDNGAEKVNPSGINKTDDR